MGSFEANYDANSLSSFNRDQLDRLKDLHGQLDLKFSEIADFLSKELGHEPGDETSVIEAEKAIERWEEDADMADEPIEPKTPLQQLLSQYHELSQRILDVRDESLDDD